MYLIDKQRRRATALERKTFSELNLSERQDLQEWIADNPRILGEELLIIQKEFAGFSDTSERLDLLALDANGKLVIIENKLDDSGKDVVWQALKYVSYCATLTKTEICQIYQRYLGDDAVAEERLSAFYGDEDYESLQLNASNADQRIILVAANFRKEVTSTVLWLQGYNIDVKCIRVTPYLDGEKLYLDTEQILPLQDVGDYQIRKRQEELVSAKAEAKRHVLRRDFWTFALPILRTKSRIFDNTSAPKENWLTGGTGRGGVWYQLVIRMGDARAEMRIDLGDLGLNMQLFNALHGKKEEIEARFNGTIVWDENLDHRVCRIYTQYERSGLTDVAQWERVAAFFADSVAEFERVFKQPLDEAIRV